MSITNSISPEEMKARDKLLVDKICSDDNFAYYFLHDKCRPLLSNILWTIFGNNAEYDELVNDLYVQLKKPDSNGEMWHALQTFDYRTSLFDWIKTVAIRFFYTPSNETFNVPETIIESGLFEDIIGTLNKAVYRKFFRLKYVDKLETSIIAEKLDIDTKSLTKFSREAVRHLKREVENSYPEVFNILFRDDSTSVVRIDDVPKKEYVSTETDVDSRIDVFKFLSSMPNQRYRKVIEALFLDDVEPEELARRMNTPVSNIYNIKSRGIDQLRDLAIHFNEIKNLGKYINLLHDDIKQTILTSIFLEHQDYESVCSKLNITEVKLKKLKKEAIKEIKDIIFNSKK